MKLEQLRTNFLEVSDAQRLELFTSYYARREKDLEQVVVKVPKKRAAGKKPSERKIPVTPTELQMLKKLGLI